jgi:hypothetical protein
MERTLYLSDMLEARNLLRAELYYDFWRSLTKYNLIPFVYHSHIYLYTLYYYNVESKPYTNL